MGLAAGQSLSFYELVGPLGAGGMGEVWRARDKRLGREVALKVLPERFASDEERLRRFEREARTLAALQHPNIAAIFGIDQVGDTCFIAMELVAGEDLAARLAAGALLSPRASTSAGRSRRDWRRRTRRVSCTATSSPGTCASRPAAWSSSSTSDSRSRSARRRGRRTQRAPIPTASSSARTGSCSGLRRT